MKEEKVTSFVDVVRREVMEMVNDRACWCPRCSTFMPVEPEIEIREENGKKVAEVKIYCVACDTYLDTLYWYE